MVLMLLIPPSSHLGRCHIKKDSHNDPTPRLNKCSLLRQTKDATENTKSCSWGQTTLTRRLVSCSWCGTPIKRTGSYLFDIHSIQLACIHTPELLILTINSVWPCGKPRWYHQVEWLLVFSTYPQVHSSLKCRKLKQRPLDLLCLVDYPADRKPLQNSSCINLSKK